MLLYSVSPLCVIPGVAGVGFTVTVETAVPVQLFAVPVTVYVVVVVKLGVVTFEPLPIFGLHVYVLAPLATKSAVKPLHIDVEPTLTFGRAVTVTVANAVLVQPLVVPVTVYVVVVVKIGVVTFEPLPMFGLQLYVSAPVTVASSVVLVPLGIDISSPAFTTGKAFTVTVIVAVVAHSPAVGVNVYTVGPVIVVFIVAGDQVPVIPLFDVVGNIPGVTPEQYGPNCVKVGVTLVLTVTVTDPATLVQPLTVAVTLYCPAAAVVTFTIVGFCNVDVNPFGPVQL